MVGGGGIGNRLFLEPKRIKPHKTASRGEEKRVTVRYQTFFFFYNRRPLSPLHFRYTHFSCFYYFSHLTFTVFGFDFH